MRTNRLFTGLLLALIAMLNLQTVEAQSPKGQNALYNYRNDGQFNAWLNIDIDSITYSRVDTLGIEHDDVVVQEVWTPDSLYRIPIEAIDSIGFQRPNTIFKPGIFIIEQKHLPYIISSDGTYVLFRYGSPANMMPHKGQVVYSDLEEEPFPMGFAGRVVEIIENSEGINYVCKPVSPGEVYEKYLDVIKIYSEGDDNVVVADANSRPLRIKRNIGDDGTINL